jgi:tetratricopeptide (TPR) repeat protein
MQKLKIRRVILTIVALAIGSTPAFALRTPDPTHAPDFEEGCRQMQLKHFDNAITILTGAIADMPKDSLAYFRRGQCFLCLSQYDQAIQDFDHAIQIESQVPTFYLWRGTAEAKLDKDDLAIRDYEQAMRLDPALVVSYNKSHEKPKEDPSTAATASEVIPSSDTTKKTATIELGKSENALKDYAEAVGRLTTRTTAYFRSGTVFSGLCEIDPSGKVIRTPPDNPNGTLTKKNGADYFELKKPAVALRQADDEITKSPSTAKPYFVRGQAHEQIGEKMDALKDLTRAIELDQNNTQFILARAFLYHQMSDSDRFESDVKHAIEIDPTLPRVITFTASFKTEPDTKQQ